MTTAKPRPPLAPGETRAYPVLPLRDTVVFPHMIAPLFVGRKSSAHRLENLRAIIANAQGRGEEARDMESVVAWLLWMLGFSVAHLNTRRTRDAADLLVTSPAGHFAVVECTTGLLKAENKLSLLHERACCR